LSIERSPHFNGRIYSRWDVFPDVRENKRKAEKKEDEKVGGRMMDGRAQAIRAGKLVGRHQMAEDRRLKS
jgi:hypothetical protein